MKVQRKLFIIPFLILFFATVVFAADPLTCQYKKTIVISEETVLRPYDLVGNELKDPLFEYENPPYAPSGPEPTSTLTNLNLVKISITYTPDFTNNCQNLFWDVNIGPFEKSPIFKPVCYTWRNERESCGCPLFTGKLKIDWHPTPEIELKPKTIQHTQEVCDGKDDGASCNSASECGGNFCVENRCNSQPICYQNNCQCNANKVQCADNITCVVKGSLELGSKPICAKEECKSNAINPNTGECSLENGQNCSISKNCISNYCVQGACSDSTACYQKDCKCGVNQIQCGDKTRCVEKKAIDVGSKPVCGIIEECVVGRFSNSSYINAEGRCDQTPGGHWIEIMGMTLIFLLIILGTGYFALKYRQGLEDERKKKEFEEKAREIEFMRQKIAVDEEEIKVANIKIEKIHRAENSLSEFKEKKTKTLYKIEELNKEISKKKNQMSVELNKLKKLKLNKKNEADLRKKVQILEEQENELQSKIKSRKLELTELINNEKKDSDFVEEKHRELEEKKEIEKNLEESKKQIIKVQEELKIPRSSPFTSGKIWCDPNQNCYECFWNGEGKDNSKLLHRYLWDKYYPNEPSNGFEIHHIDGDKHNNDPKNLVRLTREQHNKYVPSKKPKIAHSKIRNRESGLAELKRIGVDITKL